MIQSIYKTILFILLLAALAGFFFATAMFLVKSSCSSSSNDNLCAPMIDGNNNPYYRQEKFACWKQCAPKTPRLNAKTCECTCMDVVYMWVIMEKIKLKTILYSEGYNNRVIKINDKEIVTANCYEEFSFDEVVYFIRNALEA